MCWSSHPYSSLFCVDSPSAGSLQKRLQALFTREERPNIQIKPHKPKSRPIVSSPDTAQTEQIRSSESAERSQELNRLFDGCLSLHPSATIPPRPDPATPRVESASSSGGVFASSGESLSGSGNSSGNVAALVAAFSGNTIKTKVSPATQLRYCAKSGRLPNLT